MKKFFVIVMLCAAQTGCATADRSLLSYDDLAGQISITRVSLAADEQPVDEGETIVASAVR